MLTILEYSKTNQRNHRFKYVNSQNNKYNKITFRGIKQSETDGNQGNKKEKNNLKSIKGRKYF